MKIYCTIEPLESRIAPAAFVNPTTKFAKPILTMANVGTVVVGSASTIESRVPPCEVAPRAAVRAS